MTWLCKIFGHNYSYHWICERCGDHAGFRDLAEAIKDWEKDPAKKAALDRARANLAAGTRR